MLTAKSKPTVRELPPEEPTQAVCAFVVDCGEHEERSQQTGEISLKPKLMLIFELAALRSDGKRHVLSQKFTNSLHKKSRLRPFLSAFYKKISDQEAKDGVPLDPLVGVNAFITPEHNNGYANIGPIMKCPAGLPPMTPTMTSLPFWVHEYIAKAKVPPEGYKAPAKDDGGQRRAEPQAEEDLPF